MEVFQPNMSGSNKLQITNKEFDAEIAKVKAEAKAEAEAKIAELEAQAQEATEELTKIRCDTEIYVFLAYLVGADIPPPPIPSLWHKDRNLMQRSLYSMIMDVKKKRPELFVENCERPLTNKIWTYMRRLINT